MTSVPRSKLSEAELKAKKSARGKAYYAANRDAINAQRRAAYHANPEKHAARSKQHKSENRAAYLAKAKVRNMATSQRRRDQRLRRVYGVGADEWGAMFFEQDLRCRLCKTDASQNGHWHTDHNHKTGRVRGILCNACNTGLGHFQEDPGTLRQAALYLESFDK